MKKFLILLTITVNLLFGCTTETEPSETQVIKIGASGPLTGDYAWLGQENVNGTKLALEEESNEQWQFEIIIEDDQCDPKSAVNAYNKMKGEGAIAIAGSACSAATISMAALAERDKMVIVSPSASTPDLTTAGDFIFRIIPSDAYAGKVAAEVMYEQFKITKIGINAKNDAWGQGLSRVFSERFEELGGEITTIEKHEANATDMKTQLTKIKNSDAQAIYGPTFSPETVVMVKQMQELGMGDWLYFAGDAAKDNATAEKLIDATNEIHIPSVAENTDKHKQEFIKKYVEMYGAEPEGYAAEGYDAGKLLAQAIKEVGTDPEAIRDYLYQVQNYNGASGIINIDENGDAIGKDIALYTYKDGKVVQED